MVQLKQLFKFGLLSSTAMAVQLDVSSIDSIHAAQALVAQGLMDYYNGDDYGGTPGMFVPPYYWWEAGVAWGAMLDYTYYTGNDTYVDTIKEGMLFQVGPNRDYMPPNQTSTEGNDDQGFWGVSVMAAAEQNFSNPPAGQPQWLALAQAVFNTMASRWETGSCGGGLRWQIYPWNNGWTYKNSVGNGCLFHIGARLARFTGNSSYFDWAEKVWNWMEDVHFLNYTLNEQTLSVYDGADMAVNCTDIRPLEWTYNTGLMMSGAAYLYNMTEDQMWLDRVNNLWNRALVFFNGQKVMYEAACQPSGRCNNDQRSFKGIFARFLGLTMIMAPTMNDVILEYLQATANAVALSCSGGTDGHTCGLNWFGMQWDGMYGLGEQISALGVLNALLQHQAPPPLTAKTGGTSQGDPGAGTSSGSFDSGTSGGGKSGLGSSEPLDITTKDKAGAGIITALVVALLAGAGTWLIL